MKLYEELIIKRARLSIIGLGYVGIPLAVAFGKRLDVIGYDRNQWKVDLYRSGVDITKEVGNENLQQSNIHFTTEEEELQQARFHIVAVPTPINKDKTPNLEPLIKASETVGRNLVRNSIVVYESTVYPGVTEEICVPILEKESGFKCGIDFKVGYSPERINPGDQEHRLESIVKVVSGMDDDTLDTIAKVYDLIIKAGVYRAESIKVAEAAKVIENSQRDINIAFMNELSMIFNKLNIDTLSVLKAAKTKWNFLNFQPGLVGGHCIGVDPYYLTYKAEEMGYHSQIILAGRRINDYMGKYVAENTVKCLIKADQSIKGSRVGILGITFKENCPDVRNSKVMDIIQELQEYGIDVWVTDPIAHQEEVLKEYNINLKKLEEMKNMDVVIIAVKHQQYTSMKLNEIQKMFGNQNQRPVLMDIKGIFQLEEAEKLEFLYWRL